MQRNKSLPLPELLAQFTELFSKMCEPNQTAEMKKAIRQQKEEFQITTVVSIHKEFCLRDSLIFLVNVMDNDNDNNATNLCKMAMFKLRTDISTQKGIPDADLPYASYILQAFCYYRDIIVDGYQQTNFPFFLLKVDDLRQMFEIIAAQGDKLDESSRFIANYQLLILTNTPGFQLPSLTNSDVYERLYHKLASTTLFNNNPRKNKLAHHLLYASYSINNLVALQHSAGKDHLTEQSQACVDTAFVLVDDTLLEFVADCIADDAFLTDQYYLPRLNAGHNHFFAFIELLIQNLMYLETLLMMRVEQCVVMRNSMLSLLGDAVTLTQDVKPFKVDFYTRFKPSCIGHQIPPLETFINELYYLKVEWSLLLFERRGITQAFPEQAENEPIKSKNRKKKDKKSTTDIMKTLGAENDLNSILVSVPVKRVPVIGLPPRTSPTVTLDLSQDKEEDKPMSCKP